VDLRDAWSNRTEKKDAIGAEILFRVFSNAGLILLFAFPSGHQDYAKTQLWHFGHALNWTMAALTSTGLLFTWWARIHLGRLWSDRVVKRASHHVVDKGMIGSCAIRSMRASSSQLGVALVTLAFVIKARREERFLRAEVGETAYRAYARKTATLVPFVRIES